MKSSGTPQPQRLSCLSLVIISGVGNSWSVTLVAGDGDEGIA
jgi:hypothetical protein